MTTTIGRRTNGVTATRILDIAEALVQERGFNAFSYADIAAELKITTASLHYHFAGKAALGLALIERYSERFFMAIAELEAQQPDPVELLKSYLDLYTNVLRENRLCLCGMLAAEYNTLPEPMCEAVRRFLDGNEAWVARVLQAGRKAGAFSFSGAALEEARTIVGAMEGGMMLARPFGGVTRLEAIAANLIASLKPPAIED